MRTLLPLWVWAATAALRVDSDSSAADGRPRRCTNGRPMLHVDGRSVSSLAQHPNGSGGVVASSKSVTLPYLGVPSSFVPLYRSGCSPTVPYFVPVHFVPRFGMKFPERGTCHPSSFPISKHGVTCRAFGHSVTIWAWTIKGRTDDRSRHTLLGKFNPRLEQHT
jgi:hypothetical protein